MSKPTTFPVAPQLHASTEVYTQRKEAGAAEANFKFTIQAIYNLMRSEFGFRESVRHVQSLAAAKWTVTHNLNTEPVIQVYASIGGQAVLIECEVFHINANQLELRFNSPYKGFANLNP